MHAIRVIFISVVIHTIEFVEYIYCDFINKRYQKLYNNFVFEGIQQGTYQNTGSYQNYPQEQYIRPQGNSMSQQGEFNQPYSPRSHYPPYVPDVDR